MGQLSAKALSAIISPALSTYLRYGICEQNHYNGGIQSVNPFLESISKMVFDAGWHP
jgi:hypothetical protein